MKRRLAMAAIIGLLAAASVFAGGKKDSSDTVRVYQISVMSGGAAWGQCERGFYEACSELGWRGQYLAPQTANSFTDMVNLTETALTNGANVIMPCVSDNDAFADVLRRARDAGVVVIGLADGSELCNTTIGTNAANLGKNAAEALVRAVGDGNPINVCTMQTVLTSTTQNVQRQAFEDRLRELRPDAVVVSYEECDSSATKAVDKLSALYLAHPDLNSLVSFDSYAGLGAATFVEEQGLQGKFHVVGIDDAPEILRAVLAGAMDCTVAQKWYQIGYQSVYVAKAILDGEDVPASIPIDTEIIFPEDVAAWVESNGINLNE